MEQYNGWSNYPTWLLYNRLSNEKRSYDEWVTRGKDALEKSNGDKEDALGYLAREIKDAVEDSNPARGDFFGDLLAWILSEINFTEIAAALLEDVE